MIPAVQVFTSGPKGNALVGACHFSLRPGSISSSFVYDQGYLT